jgi:hypothetical protein
VLSAQAVGKIADNLDVLLEFYNYPAKHWVPCAPATRSSRGSPPSGCAPLSPSDPLTSAGVQAFKLIE